MNTQMLLENFALIASAPGGVKRLREMIHHLALTGQLSIQNSSEDVFELLSILEREKEEITKRTGGTKSLYSMRQSPVFLLPSNWVWTCLGSLSENIHYGVTAKAIDRKDGVRFLRITDIHNDHVDWISVPSCDIEEKQLNSSQLHNGDILIARTGGTIGKTYLVENLSKKAVFASYLIRFIPLKNTNSKYIKLFTNSPLYWEQLRKVSLGTGQPNVNATALKALHIPLPPVEEQHRIVAKVDELMALCDKLEAQQQERERHFPVLSRACHTRFVESPSLDNLKAIFDEAGSVSTDELRKTILTLAVQSKLTPQDPKDEPAVKLIERLELKLSQEKSQRSGTKLPRFNEEFELYTIPINWCWTYFKSVAIIASNLVNPDDFPDAIHLAPDNIEKGNG